MEQLTQKLGSGEMVIQELPMPQLSAGMVLVQNHYSLISAGTEGSTVKAARKSLIGKAKERPQQVKQVLEKLRQQGFVQTYRAVMKKLDAYSPLGYSSAGTVIGVADDVTEAVLDFAGCQIAWNLVNPADDIPPIVRFFKIKEGIVTGIKQGFYLTFCKTPLGPGKAKKLCSCFIGDAKLKVFIENQNRHGQRIVNEL